MRMHIAGTVVLECVDQSEGSEASYECITFVAIQRWLRKTSTKTNKYSICTICYNRI